MYLGNDFGTEIQIYNRSLVFIFIILAFLKNKKSKLSLSRNISTFSVFFILSIISTIFGLIIFQESSFKPIVFTMVFMLANLAPTSRNFVDNLFKVVSLFFILEIFLLLITGWSSGLLSTFYLWRPISFLGIAVPRLYGFLLDSHSSWTLFSYLLLLKIIFLDKKKMIFSLFASFFSASYQILIQNILVYFWGLPNENSYFLRAFKNIFYKKINISIIIFLIFSIFLINALLNLGYFDPNSQNSISFVFSKIVDYNFLLAPILSHKSSICLITGCSLKNSTYSFIEEAGIFYYFTTIGFFRIIYEFGLIYSILFFSSIKKAYSFTLMLFYLAGLIHYPIVMGIPFAFYIPYSYRCYKSNIKNLQ
tara:strand:+ start:358 stop:1449 length:1092 start_codon:yes stop_codon:yes gene_type:complete